MHVDDLRPRYLRVAKKASVSVPFSCPAQFQTLGPKPLLRAPRPLPVHASTRSATVPPNNPETQLPRNNQMQVHIKALPRQRPLCEYLCLLQVLRLFDALLVQENLPIGIGHKHCGKECGVMRSLCDVTLIAPVLHGYISAVNQVPSALLYSVFM
ncbi:hypothetical protein MRX96_038552 [Rhipicephalus microplus]